AGTQVVRFDLGERDVHVLGSGAVAGGADERVLVLDVEDAVEGNGRGVLGVTLSLAPVPAGVPRRRVRLRPLGGVLGGAAGCGPFGGESGIGREGGSGHAGPFSGRRGMLRAARGRMLHTA